MTGVAPPAKISLWTSPFWLLTQYTLVESTAMPVGTCCAEASVIVGPPAIGTLAMVPEVDEFAQ